MSQTCFDCGDGSAGPFILNKDTVLPGGQYNFSDFYIAEGVTLKFSGNSPVLIRCKGSVVIDGKIDISGNDGNDATDNLTIALGGAGIGGGYNGGDGRSGTSGVTNGNNGSGPGFGPGGNFSGGAGAGYGSPGYSCTGILSNTYGDSLLTGSTGGSGGGGGSPINNNASGGGGAGGGQLSIFSCYPIIIGINGKILLEGGQGGNGFQYGTGGGGGSGGTLLLTAKMIEVKGLISVGGGKGGVCTLDASPCMQGGNGGDGRIRFDCSEVAIEGNIIPGYYQKILFDAGIRRVVDAKCNGTATGFIRARANGGDKPYSFEWSNGAHSSEITNIPAGIYTITITDATGCSTTEQTTVNEPAPIVSAVETYPPTCDNANNSIVLYSVSGGTPYPYENTLATTQWSNISANGLLFSFTFQNKSSLKRMAIQMNHTGQQHLEVYYRQGIATNAAFDPTQWQKVKDEQFFYQSTEDLVVVDLTGMPQLPAGNHTIYLFSYNSSFKGVSSQVLGNTFNFDHQMTVYAGMAREASPDPFTAAQKGIMNLAGRITYTVESANGEQYLYGTDPMSGSVQTGIPAGQYQTIISDAMGCTISASYKIDPANSIDIEALRIKSPRCSDSEDGSIEVTVNTSDIEGVAATSPSSILPEYGVFLQILTNETIRFTGAEVYASSSINADVFIKRGGYSGFENDAASWTSIGTLTSSPPDAIGKILFMLPVPLQLDPDEWSICIRSQNAPFYLQSSRVNFINSPVLHLNSSAFISSSAFNQVSTLPGEYFAGTIKYSLATSQLNSYWDNNSTGPALQGLGAGTYVYTVDYNHQCSTSKSFTLTAPSAISILTSIQTETDHEGNGAIQLIAKGGTPPYFIHWPANGVTGTTIEDVPAGEYPVFIADGNGCIYRDTVTIARFNTPIKTEGWLTILPNPGQGFIKVGEEVKGMENCTLRVFDMLGRLAYQENTSISSLMSEGIDLHHFVDANYILQVSDDDQIFQARAIIIH